MKGAIETADKITTVSPSYAWEILDPWYSHGLDRILVNKQHKLTGILNGIDTRLYNPAEDPLIAKKYSADTTAEDGGLIEKIYKEQLVESIDEFLFDDARKAGDYKIVESTYGYHLVYYKGTNVEKWKIDAENYLIEQDFGEESEKLCEEYGITMTRNNHTIDVFATEQLDESIYYQ